MTRDEQAMCSEDLMQKLEYFLSFQTTPGGSAISTQECHCFSYPTF